MDYATRPQKLECLLCGKSVTANYLQTKDHLYFKWAQSYSKSLCDLLELDPSFQIIFQTADYCSNCLQIIREIDFTLQTLESLQKRLSNSRQEVHALLHENNARCQRLLTNPTRYARSSTYKLSYDNLIEHICRELPVEIKLEPLQEQCTDEKREFPLTNPIYEKPAPASVKARRNSIEKVGNICAVLLGKKGISKPERIKLIQMRQIVKPKLLKIVIQSNNQSNIGLTKENVTSSLRLNENSVKCNREAQLNIQESRKPAKLQKPMANRVTLQGTQKPGPLSNPITSRIQPPETERANEIPQPITSRAKLQETRRANEIPKPITSRTGPQELQKPDELPKPITSRIRVHCTYENCSYSCFNEPELNAHILGQHKGDSNPYHCHACPLKYTNSSNLKYHIRQHHPEKPSEAEAFISCSYCGKKFTAQDESAIHKRHESLHARSPIFSCIIPKCKTRQFSSSVDLKNHVALKHEDSVPVSKCLECNLVCANPKSLRKHIKNIHCERNPALKCKECSYIGRVPSDIVLHMTKHSDERNFHCPECNASYKNKCSLGFHMKNVHLKPGDKKHKCGQCPMAFSQASILKKHEQSHATCKLYACKKCDTRFKHIATLQAHEKHSCKGNSSKKTNTITRSRNRTSAKARVSNLPSKLIKIEKESGSEPDEPPPMDSEISIYTEESHSDSTSSTTDEYSAHNGDSIDNNINMPFSDPDPLGELQDDMDDVQPMEALDSFICSADTGDYNWINPELFGEDFATLDIFEEVETSSLISSVLPLHGSNVEVIWE